jgi:hypothetical protein
MPSPNLLAPDPFARVLIDGRYAVAIDEAVAPIVETAARAAPGLTAASPRQRARPAK